MPDLSTFAPYAAITMLLILTGAGLPVPEEAIVVGAGVAASLGKLESWPAAMVSCLVGALLGDLLAYGIGRYFGLRLLRERPWFARLMHAEREKQIEGMISRHGLKVFFLARFLVGLRSPIYLTAGILRVPVKRFLFVDAISAVVVIGLFFSLAYKYGDWVGARIRQAEYLATAAVVVGVAVAVIVFFILRKRRRQHAAESLPAPIPAPGDASAKPEERIA